jgi:hypothetical protein
MSQTARNLTVIPTRSRSKLAQPPGKLDKTGMSLWQDITAAYEFGDRASYETLFQACAMADRAAQLRDQIDKDGVMVPSSQGIRDHPLLKHELAARSFVVRALQRLGCDLEPVLAMGRPAGGRR